MNESRVHPIQVRCRCASRDISKVASLVAGLIGNCRMLCFSTHLTHDLNFEPGMADDAPIRLERLEIFYHTQQTRCTTRERRPTSVNIRVAWLDDERDELGYVLTSHNQS